MIKNLSQKVKPSEVYKMVAFKNKREREGIESGLTIVLVEN